MNHGPENTVHLPTEVTPTPPIHPVESSIRENILKVAIAGSLAVGGTGAMHEVHAAPEQSSFIQREAICIYEEPTPSIELFANANIESAIKAAWDQRSFTPIGEIFRPSVQTEPMLLERPC